MGKHGKYNLDEFGGHGKNGLLVGDSFGPPAEKMLPRELIILGNFGGQEPEEKPEVPVASLRDLALPFKYFRLTGGGIQPNISDKSFLWFPKRLISQLRLGRGI